MGRRERSEARWWWCARRRRRLRFTSVRATVTTRHGGPGATRPRGMAGARGASGQWSRTTAHAHRGSLPVRVTHDRRAAAVPLSFVVVVAVRRLRRSAATIYATKGENWLYYASLLFYFSFLFFSPRSFLSFRTWSDRRRRTGPVTRTQHSSLGVSSPPPPPLTNRRPGHRFASASGRAPSAIAAARPAGVYLIPWGTYLPTTACRRPGFPNCGGCRPTRDTRTLFSSPAHVVVRVQVSNAQPCVSEFGPERRVSSGFQINPNAPGFFPGQNPLVKGDTRRLEPSK